MNRERGSYEPPQNKKISRREFIAALGSGVLLALAGDNVHKAKKIAKKLEGISEPKKFPKSGAEASLKNLEEEKLHNLSLRAIQIEKAILLRYEDPKILLEVCKKVNNYYSQVEQIAEKYQISKDCLLGLIFVESRGDANAKNENGAAGLCQFLPDTARDYKLRVDDEVDERYIPQKSIEAAVKFLKKHKDDLYKEDLAIVAYHMGYGHMFDLIEIYLDPKPISDPPADSVKKENIDYKKIFFRNSKTFNPGTNYFLFEKLKDESAFYYWKIRAAGEIINQYLKDPANLYSECKKYRSLSRDEFREKIKKKWGKTDLEQLDKFKLEKRV